MPILSSRVKNDKRFTNEDKFVILQVAREIDKFNYLGVNFVVKRGREFDIVDYKVEV